MKRFLATLAVFASVACAQESSGSAQPKAPEPGAKGSAKSAVVCRLESVTWNPVRAEMTWVVSIWDVKSDSDRPAAVERYSIHPDAAVMEFNGEARTFDPAEAKHVRMLMDMITTYSVHSTVWWDHGGDSEPDGQVIPLPKDKDGGETNGNRDSETKGKGDGKQEDPKAAPKPLPAVLRGRIALEVPAKPAEPAATSH
jgi:hypothetical protein